MLPQYNQARKVVWDGIDREGRRMIDQAFPMELRSGMNDQEMKIELKCGSIWQLVGSDNYDSLVGANPVGVVFSEYAVADPRAWDYLRPILTENKGWALFIYTFRGRNHGHKLWKMAQGNPDWFCQTLTVDDTWGNGGTVSPEDVEAERREAIEEGKGEALIQQEYYCNVDAPVQGAYYADLFLALKKDKRLTRVPYEPLVPVTTAWDLGMHDDMSIWFAQKVGFETRIIDHFSDHGKGLDYYCQAVRARGYQYEEHLVPHDAQVRELTYGGKSRLEFLQKQGVGRFRALPRWGLEDGHQAVRALLPGCWFDSAKCGDGVESLINHHRDKNEKTNTFVNLPVKDWTSHDEAAFRYLAQGLRAPTDKKPRKTQAETEYAELG